MDTYLSPSRFIDSDHPAVVEFAEKHRGTRAATSNQAVSLYYAVREAIRYNPYTFSRDSDTLNAGPAWRHAERFKPRVNRRMLLRSSSHVHQR